MGHGAWVGHHCSSSLNKPHPTLLFPCPLLKKSLSSAKQAAQHWEGGKPLLSMQCQHLGNTFPRSSCPTTGVQPSSDNLANGFAPRLQQRFLPLCTHQSTQAALRPSEHSWLLPRLHRAATVTLLSLGFPARMWAFKSRASSSLFPEILIK